MQQPPSDDIPEQLLPAEQRARAVLKTLPFELQEATLICPLCGTTAPARGLRARALHGADEGQWQLVFACPACGLLTAFETTKLTPAKIEAINTAYNNAWLQELERFEEVPRSDTLNYTREAGFPQMLGTFAIAFLTWMFLIGNFNATEVIWGVVVSMVVARLTYRFAAVDLPNWIFQPRRWLALGALSIEFVRQLVFQNITLSIRVFRPSLPIRPGIVAVPTKLRGDVPLTLLGSLTTLTPDTVMLDIDPDRGIVYVHWIDVKTTDPNEAYLLISASIEEKIARWLL